MNAIKALKAFACATALIAAREPILVPDVSQREIEIAYSFTGAELLLFGAILYPDGRLPAKDADIAVVLKGPTQSVTLREKQKLRRVSKAAPFPNRILPLRPMRLAD